MNGLAETSGKQAYYLTDLLGSPVTVHGKSIGKLADLVIVETDPLPEVTKLYIHRSFGQPSLLIPLEKMKVLKAGEIVVSIDEVKPFESEPQAKDILLKDHILDKKVIDIEDRDVEIVYDVKMVVRGRKLLVSDVNISRYRLMRRLGPKWLAKLIYSFRSERRDEKIPWQYIQALPPNIGSFKGDVKLNILKETLAEIHPADMADILEELDSRQRVAVFDQLESDRASDTLEEIDPNVQRDIVALLPKDRVAQLLAKMTPGQAADVLSVLPHNEKREILLALRALNESLAQKTNSILDRQDERIANYATTRILRVAPDMSVAEAREYFNRAAPNMMVIMYLYVTDTNGKLIGALDIKELLHARDDQKLRDVMIGDPIALRPTSTLKEALEHFSRYDFRALPIVDNDDKLLGAIPYRDVVNLKHKFWE